MPDFGGTALGSAFVEIGGDFSRLSKDFASAKRLTETATAKMGSSIKTRLTGAFRDVSAGIKKYEQSINQLSRTFVLAGGAMVGAIGLTVREAVKYEKLNKGLIAVGGSAGEAAKQMTRLREIAKLPGLALSEVVEASISLQAVGTQAQNAERWLKAVGNALATVGKGRAELGGVNLAMTQMITKGKVMGDDLRQMANYLPQIRRAMMDAFGSASTEELQKMGITAEQFMAKVTEQLEKLPPVSGGAANAIENLRDSFSQFLNTLGQNLLPAFSSALNIASSMIEKTNKWASENKALAGTLVKIGAVMGGLTLAGGAFGLMSVQVVKIVTAFGALREMIYLNVLPAIWKLGSALATFAANPAVIAAAAIAAISAALVILYRRASDSKRIVDELAKSVENLPALSKIEIDVEIKKAQKRLRILQDLYWDLIEQQKKLKSIYEEEAKARPGFGEISRREVGQALAVIGERIRANVKAYNEIDQALRKLMETQGRYEYAATSVSAEVLAATQEELRSILQKIQRLKEEEQQYDNLLAKADKWTNPALIRRWEKALANVRAELEKAKGEYTDIDSRLMGMYKSMANAAKATEDASKAASEAVSPIKDLAKAHGELAQALDESAKKQDLVNKNLKTYETQLGKISEAVTERTDEAIKAYQFRPIKMGKLEVAPPEVPSKFLALPKISPQTIEYEFPEQLVPFKRQEEMILGFRQMYEDDNAQQKYWAERGAEIEEERAREIQKTRDWINQWTMDQVVALNEATEAEEEARQARDAELFEQGKQDYIDALNGKQKASAAFYEQQKKELDTLYKDHQQITKDLEEGWKDMVDGWTDYTAEFANVAHNLARQIKYAFSDLFASMIDPSVKPAWAQFWDDLKSIAINALAEIAWKMAALKWTEKGWPGAEAMLGGAIGGIGKGLGALGIGGTLAATAGIAAGGYGLYKLFDALLGKEDKADQRQNLMNTYLAQILAEEEKANQNLDDTAATIAAATAEAARRVADAIFGKQRGAREAIPRGELVWTQPIAEPVPLTRLERLQLTRGTRRTIEEFQYGGIVRRPTVAMVGEAGPEAIVPLRRGTAERQIQPQIIQPNITMSPGAIQITEEFPNVRLDTMTMDQRMRMYEKTLRPQMEEWARRGMFLDARR